MYMVNNAKSIIILLIIIVIVNTEVTVPVHSLSPLVRVFGYRNPIG